MACATESEKWELLKLLKRYKKNISKIGATKTVTLWYRNKPSNNQSNNGVSKLISMHVRYRQFSAWGWYNKEVHDSLLKRGSWTEVTNSCLRREGVWLMEGNEGRRENEREGKDSGSAPDVTMVCSKFTEARKMLINVLCGQKKGLQKSPNHLQF